MTEWGSPHLKDPTARLEQKADASLSRIKERLEALADTINRPPGTLRVSPAVQREEFQRKIQSPEELQKVHADAVARLGEEDGFWEFADWLKKMTGETNGV